MYQILKRSLAVITIFVITGCSIVNLGYNRLPFLTLLELDSIFNLTDEQKKNSSPRIRFLARMATK